MSSKNGAIEVAKRRSDRAKNNEPVRLSTGEMARFNPVSISIITEAQAAVPEPPVPMWYNEDKDKHEPNPNHPDYAKALEEAEGKRNLAAVDAIIMFGVELVDGVPEDDGWIKKLKLRNKLGLSNIDLSEFDFTDPIEREFLYKKYIAVTTADVQPLMEASNLTEQEVASATKSFQDN